MPDCRDKNDNSPERGGFIFMPEQKVKKKWIGLILAECAKGVQVLIVHKEGPARTAGFKRGDIILSVGDKEVAYPGEVCEITHDALRGTKLSMKIDRYSKLIELRVAVEYKPESELTFYRVYRSLSHYEYCILQILLDSKTDFPKNKGYKRQLLIDVLGLQSDSEFSSFERDLKLLLDKNLIVKTDDNFEISEQGINFLNEEIEYNSNLKTPGVNEFSDNQDLFES